MFPSHVLALLLVRDANNASDFRKGPGLRQKKAWAGYAARVPFRSLRKKVLLHIYLECFSCIFCNEAMCAENVFPRRSAMVVAVLEPDGFCQDASPITKPVLGTTGRPRL